MPPAHLLDGNVLVALCMPDHVHHGVARTWLAGSGAFATCPTVQGTLLRVLLRQGSGISRAVGALEVILRLPRHEQWLDDLSYEQVDLTHVRGHRQVTDAYLAQLARARGGRVATLDRGFAMAAPDVADMLPV